MLTGEYDCISIEQISNVDVKIFGIDMGRCMVLTIILNYKDGALVGWFTKIDRYSSSTLEKTDTSENKKTKYKSSNLLNYNQNLK